LVLIILDDETSVKEFDKPVPIGDPRIMRQAYSNQYLTVG